MKAWCFYLRQRKFRSCCFQSQVFDTYPKRWISNKIKQRNYFVVTDSRFYREWYSDLITSNCHTFTKIYVLKRTGQDNKLIDILKKRSKP